ncbi:FAD-binding protein [Candidatus Bathyarchaeota archaeon]|nr:FAD-binding protein [Candidatus Bathyarchaeota archaeon]MBS7631131.1 FAD-binding protein [Candidatus Bathyarchaeota archaeon]
MVKLFDTGVLVVGAGAAGLRASIEARSRGVQVSIVSKTPAGMNNATAVSGGGFRATLGGLTPEEHFRDTLTVGKGINDSNLVRIFSKEGGERVSELRRFGVEIRISFGGAHVGEPFHASGYRITKPMVDYARKIGVKFHENVIITKILKEEGEVIGAVGYDIRNDEPTIFSAKAVILATGGAGALYKRTDCPFRTVGDGYSLAYSAGAKLRDMEFVQFFPLALAEADAPPHLLGGALTEESRIINRLGEDIAEKHRVNLRPLVLKSRDLLSRAIMIEILEGRGVDNAVLIDARDYFKKGSKEGWFSSRSYEFFKERLKGGEKPLRVAPISHFCMGGIIIDGYGHTGVAGLFAAGEVVGGLHGANRHGGNALTEAIVFGARAGEAAAEFAESRIHPKIESEAQPELERYKTIRDGGSAGAINPRTILNQLRDLMWTNAGIVRDEKSLSEALDTIIRLRGLLPMLRASQNSSMLEALETPMALDAAEMIVRAAFMRTESRGAHYRRDYPKEDPSWRASVNLSLGAKGDIILEKARI